MEGSEGEKVFDLHGLNPRLFVNETLNSIDDVVNGAFDFFLERSRELVRVSNGDAGESDRSEELVRGVSLLRDNIQSVLDKRLSFWENYCLHHCFSVPEGFSSTIMDATCNISGIMDSVSDKDLDDQLQSLRSKIAQAGKEHTELQQEILALEKRSVLINHYNSFVEEALELAEKNSINDLVQDIAKSTPSLLEKLDELTIKEKQHKSAGGGNICSNYAHLCDDGLGLGSNLQNLQEFVRRLKNK